MSEQSIEQIAGDVLKCALAHDPDACLVGNVTALEMARMAVATLTTCPACGAEAWCNLDCHVCEVCTLLE